MYINKNYKRSILAFMQAITKKHHIIVLPHLKPGKYIETQTHKLSPSTPCLWSGAMYQCFAWFSMFPGVVILSSSLEKESQMCSDSLPLPTQ